MQYPWAGTNHVWREEGTWRVAPSDAPLPFPSRVTISDTTRPQPPLSNASFLIPSPVTMMLTNHSHQARLT
jgi:hypothetical protein